MTRRRLAGLAGGLALVAGLLAIELADAQQIHRNGFETLKMGWAKGGFDAPYDEKVHTISDQVAHEGRHSEYIQFDARPGKFIHYAYSVKGKAVISDELSAGLWLKSNRPGMTLMARIVLPRERDPQNLDYLLTTSIHGDAYQQVGQWQRLELGRPIALAKQQQQIMQKTLGGKSIDFTDAYIDGLILNVYGGPGPTDVWIDDVEIGPVLVTTPIRAAATTIGPRDAKPAFPSVMPRADSKGVPTFTGSQLQIASRPFLMRGIYVTDTPIAKLREARINVVFLPEDAPPSLAREASDRGLWVVPMLPTIGADGKPMAEDVLAQKLAPYGEIDPLFIAIKGPLRYEQVAQVDNEIGTINRLDPGRMVGGDVRDGVKGHALKLKLLGAHRWPLGTTLELPQYRQWLHQRLQLASSNVLLWTTVQTHMPDAIAQALYERPAAGPFNEPVGPQAEHVQLLTYTALAAGVRGLAYSSDRFLADSHLGRDRLLACALMNLELEMLEPLIATADDAPEWVDTSSPDVKAAVLRSKLGILILPVWQGPFSQIVPGQSAVNKLIVNAPPMPHSMRAWEISPADVVGLKAERVVGSTKITLPEFGLTGAIVLTGSTELIARFQEQAKGRRQLAAQWAHDMAAYELDKVLKTHELLVQQKQTVSDAQNLLLDAQKRLKLSRAEWERRAFPEAYREAQRSLRPLRILMRAEWEKAVRGTDSAMTSPYTASYFTLPRHWQLMDQIAAGTWGKNVLPGGDFETLPARPEDTWHLDDRPPLDEVELIAQRVGEVTQPEKKKEKSDNGKDDKKDPKNAKPTDDEAKPLPVVKAPPHEGKLCAMLKVVPRNKDVAPPRVLERTILCLTSPTVRLQPGTIVRVSGWVCIPKPIAASPDGALLYDSTAGDAFGLRLTSAMQWKRFAVFRRVPASGTIQVTLALTGLGTVFFDDIRVEPLIAAAPH